MTLAEFIQELSDRVQIDAADEQLKQLVMNPALSSVQIPANLMASVSSKLMTENEAKNNFTIKKHFTGTALSTVDSKIKDLLDEFAFDDETKTNILSEQSTYNRIPMLAKAISDAKERSISATGGEKKTLVDKIGELHDIMLCSLLKDYDFRQDYINIIFKEYMIGELEKKYIFGNSLVDIAIDNKNDMINIEFSDI